MAQASGPAAPRGRQPRPENGREALSGEAQPHTGVGRAKAAPSHFWANPLLEIGEEKGEEEDKALGFLSSLEVTGPACCERQIHHLERKIRVTRDPRKSLLSSLLT